MSRIAINAMAMGNTKAGVGRFISELLNALARVDQDNEYLVFTTAFGRKQLHLNGNWTVRTPKLSLPARLMWEQLVLPSLLKKHGIDLFHGQGFTVPLRKITPSVVTIYDMTWFSHGATHERIKTLYFRNMIPISIRHADRILAISDSARDDILRMFPEAAPRTMTTHGGVARVFHDTPDDRVAADRALARYGIPEPYILSVGMIQPRKNLTRLIQAFAWMRRDHDLLHRLVVVGKKGWKTDEVFSLIDEAGLAEHVVFTGFVPDEDLVHIYRRSDVFAYPSLYEGFGLPVVEAMASGAAVLTSDNSSMIEVAGDAAELCEPTSVDDIAAKLWSVINDRERRAALIEKGHLRAQAFTWEQTARRTLQAYQEALANQETLL